MTDRADALEARAFAVFDEVCEAPPADRDRLLESLCADDRELRTLVESMLRHDSEIADTDEQPGAGARLIAGELFGDDAGEADRIPERIGRYRIVREIGRGGMGIVFEGEQDDPRRRVALKIIRDIGGFADVRRRFRREAHLLGQLQHRGIAHIYEAGTAPIGGISCPFLAMELVDGAPLETHAADAGLDLRGRLELIARVCDAVQHAHQKGIIHRDLKPANVLVVREQTGLRDRTGTGYGTVADTIGQPKVLDFGVARFADADPQNTLRTQAGQIVGTLAFMSPEQLRGDGAAVDTRADVFALGVMLYRLVEGRPPFELDGLSIPEAIRTVEQKEPPPLRSVDAALRGDIETIVRKAIEKDPERRYESAGAMGEDLRRCIRDEPILARRATPSYQFRKFARRNSALVAGATATGVALVAGLVASLWLLAAVSIERDAARLARERQSRIAVFQSDVLTSIDMRSVGEQIRLRFKEELAGRGADPAGLDPVAAIDAINATNLAHAAFESSLIDRAAAQIDRSYSDDPLIEAPLRETVARMYEMLVLPGKQLVQDERALELRLETLDPDHPDTLRSLGRCASAANDVGRFEEAVRYCRASIAGHERRYGPEHTRTATEWFRLAGMITRSDPAEAEAILLRLGSTTFIGDDGVRKVRRDPRGLLAGLYRETGRSNEAIPIFEELVEEYPWQLNFRVNLGHSLRAQGRDDLALEQFRIVVRDAAERFGEDHEITIVNRNNLARVLIQLDKPEEAGSALRAAYESSVRGLSPTRPHRAQAALDWAQYLISLGRWVECDAVLSEAITSRVDVGRVGDDLSLSLLSLHAECLRARGLSDRAEITDERWNKIRSTLKH
jgi:serine/threonine protein kinase/tetratricopeptide (TPR) repeat protein